MRCAEALAFLHALKDAEDVSAIESFVGVLEREVAAVNSEELSREAAERMDARRRRYGKTGALLGPLGYFCPAPYEKLFANVWRGRLHKKDEGVLFVYDFDREGQPVRIVNRELRTVSFCERVGNTASYLSFRNAGNAKDITATLAIWNDARQLEREASVRWWRFSKMLGSVCLGMYLDAEHYAVFDAIMNDDGQIMAMTSQVYQLMD